MSIEKYIRKWAKHDEDQAVEIVEALRKSMECVTTCGNKKERTAALMLLSQVLKAELAIVREYGSTIPTETEQELEQSAMDFLGDDDRRGK